LGKGHFYQHLIQSVKLVETFKTDQRRSYGLPVILYTPSEGHLIQEHNVHDPFASLRPLKHLWVTLAAAAWRSRDHCKLNLAAAAGWL
jgi:hypothetical protein